MSDGVQSQNQLVTVGPDNESQGVGGIEAGILAPINTDANKPDFKNDREVMEWITANVIQIMPEIRSNYMNIHEEWTKINNMLSMTMEDDASYKGETEVYLPTFAKAMETRVAHVCKASFPTDSYLDAVSLKVETPMETAARNANKAWMKKQIESNAKLRSNLKPLVRNALALGVGILKPWWEDSLVKQKKSKHKSAAGPTMDSLLAKQQSKKYRGKLRCKTVNNFAFYAHPLSVDSLEQCTLIFEDIQVSKQYVETMIKHNYWNREDISIAAQNIETESKRQETLIQNTKTSNTAISGSMAGDLGSFIEVSECWFEMHLPDKYFTAAEIADGDNLDPQAMKAVICGGVVISIEYNPFNHGKPPYLMKKLTSIPDVLITPGYGKMVMTSQYLVNDLVNQVNDNGIFGLQPMLLRDITKIAGHSLKQTIHPGATFDVTDKGAIEFDRPPIEQIQHGLQLLQVAVSQVNDPIAPPILQGSGSSGAGKTATGAQLLQNNTKTDIQDFNEDMEQEIFTPFMNMAYSLGQQFESEEMFLAITGQQQIKFSPEMLAMDVSWQWVASTQTVNQQLRGQQMGVFLQTVVNPAVMQALALKGVQLDLIPILSKMWEDGLGQRAFETLLVKQPMIPGMGGAPMPGMPPTPGAVSPEQISSVSQNPNAAAMPPTSPVQGEGEQFRNVRNEAEATSGAMGILANAKQ